MDPIISPESAIDLNPNDGGISSRYTIRAASGGATSLLVCQEAFNGSSSIKGVWFDPDSKAPLAGSFDVAVGGPGPVRDGMKRLALKAEASNAFPVKQCSDKLRAQKVQKRKASHAPRAASVRQCFRSLKKNNSGLHSKRSR